MSQHEGPKNLLISPNDRDHNNYRRLTDSIESIWLIYGWLATNFLKCWLCFTDSSNSNQIFAHTKYFDLTTKRCLRSSAHQWGRRKRSTTWAWYQIKYVQVIIVADQNPEPLQLVVPLIRHNERQTIGIGTYTYYEIHFVNHWLVGFGPSLHRLMSSCSRAKSTLRWLLIYLAQPMDGFKVSHEYITVSFSLCNDMCKCNNMCILYIVLHIFPKFEIQGIPQTKKCSTSNPI